MYSELLIEMILEVFRNIKDNSKISVINTNQSERFEIKSVLQLKQFKRTRFFFSNRFYFSFTKYKQKISTPNINSKLTIHAKYQIQIPN